MKRICILISTTLATFIYINSSLAAGDLVVKLQLTQKQETSKAISGKASFSEVTPVAQKIGFDDMLLLGHIQEQPMHDGTFKVRISWDKAMWQQRQTSIQPPFASGFVADRSIEQGDIFQAIGEGEALLAAWKRLQKHPEPKETIQIDAKKEEITHVVQSRRDYAYPQVIHRGIEGVVTAPIIEQEVETGLSSEATKTEDGCGLRHDFETGMTYVQTREVVDVHGELIEQSSCTDSEMSYQHTETADGCHIVVDAEQKVANQQTRIVFDQDGVDVQARECRDSAITYPLVATAEGCSMVHDYNAGQSVQQVRYTYTSESGVIEAVSCADDESQTYAHVVTTEGCDMIIDNNVMIPQNRIYIEVGGITVYLNECTPDTSASVPVFAETCDPAYTHDFLVGQSYLNTRYYYDDNGSNVYVTECAASTTSYAHEIDTEQCPMAHDDTTKFSQLMGSYYIMVEGNRVDISSCLPVGDPIPYVQANNHWRATGTVSDVPLDVSNNSVVAINIFGSDAMIDEQYQQQGWQYNDPNNQFGQLGLCDSYGSCYDRPNLNHADFKIYSYQYCFEQIAPVPWVTDGGQTLDRDHSDQSPTWQGDHLLPINNYCNEGQATYVDQSCNEVPEGSYAWNAYQYCTTPACDVTTLEKNPTWERGDQSLYYDTTTIIETKLVCGAGNLLDGEEG